MHQRVRFTVKSSLFVSFAQSDGYGGVLASEDTMTLQKVGVYARLIQTKILVARGNQGECQLSKRNQRHPLYTLDTYTAISRRIEN
jgi:hypothetical protein